MSRETRASRGRQATVLSSPPRRETRQDSTTTDTSLSLSHSGSLDEPVVSKTCSNTGPQPEEKETVEPLSKVLLYIAEQDARRRDEATKAEEARRKEDREREERMQQLFLQMLSQQTERENLRLQAEEARRQSEKAEWEQEKLRLQQEREREREREEAWRREELIREKEREEQRRQEEMKRLEQRQRELKLRDAPKMPPMKDDADIEDFLCDFEMQAEDLELPRERWLLYLRPLLTQRVRDATTLLKQEERADYDQVRKTILETCTTKKGDLGSRWWTFTRKKGETFSSVLPKGARLLNRYTEQCKTMDELRGEILKEQFLQMIPFVAQSQIRDKDPKSAMEVVQLADRFFEERHSSPDLPRWQGRQQFQPKLLDKFEKTDPDSSPAASLQKFSKKTSGQQSKAPTRKSDKEWLKTIECFNCHQLGHLAANCPTKVLATMLPTKSTNRHTPAYRVTGAIEGEQFDNLLVDSAAEVTVLQPKAVPRTCYTDQTRVIAGVTGHPAAVPTAKVIITVNGYQAQVEAVVAQLGEDMLLGRDLPFFNDLLTDVAHERQLKGNEVLAVSTRKQTKAAAYAEALDEELSATSGATPTALENQDERSRLIRMIHPSSVSDQTPILEALIFISS